MSISRCSMIRAILSVLSCVLFGAGCSPSGSAPQPREYTGDARVDLPGLLPVGTATAILMDSLYVSPRRAELEAKFRLAMQENPQWLEELQDSVFDDDEPLPFDSRLGFTPEEWDEYLALQRNLGEMRSFPSGRESIEIEREGDIIRMRSSGKLEILNDVSFDLARNVVFVDTVQLGPQEPFTVDSNNILHTPWKGYLWHYTLTHMAPTDRGRQSYTIVVGFLEKTRQTYMVALKRIVRNGVTTDSITRSFVFE